MPTLSPLAHTTLVLLLSLGLAGCEPVSSEPKHSGETGQSQETDSPVLDSDTGGGGGDDSGCDTADPDAPSWYRDYDEDGYGNEAVKLRACEQPEGYVADASDCDDASAAINPGATESCNDQDDDCDGSTDEDYDDDLDGYLSAACPTGTDCDDGDPTTYPGATETCNDDIDSDCDGADLICGYESDLGLADAKLYATGRSDDAGRHMDAGDIDGDGIEDAVVGAMWADSYQGSAWVVYGPVSGTHEFDDTAIEVRGGSGAYEGGRTVGVADVDEDGYDDVMLGSPDASLYDAVVFHGPITDATTFADADVRITCTASVECGHGGDAADINGDGVPDAIVGAGEEMTGGYSSGSVYLLFGPLSAATTDLRSLADVELVGDEDGSETGRVLTAGKDMNGDGMDDLLITAGYDSEGGPDAGAVHVVQAPVEEDAQLADSDGKLLGSYAYEYVGEALTMGDVDGDGYADAVVGAYQSARGGGRAYVMFGPTTGTVSLSSSDVIAQGSSSEGLGVSLASRDADGDEIEELLVGASTDASAGAGAGAAYLFYGPLSAGTLSPSDAGDDFLGEARSDAAGSGVGFGDLDGNGLPDVMIGATNESTGAMAGGAWYLLLSGV